MKMTVELFDNIINTSQDCVFWKDKERRFLGVNQAFLDFYGFESAEVLLGKTDEDMGWHNDPEPYKQDELRVLSGESTYKVRGKCMVRGEERDIIASKRPLYEGDEIVGLVGSFVDITDVLRRHSKMEGLQVLYDIDSLRHIPYFDSLLDETGLDEVLDPLTGVICRAYALDFVHSLISKGTPFTFTIIDLDNFKFINDTFGHSSGDTVLKNVSGSLVDYLGDRGIVGRFGGDELLIVDLYNLSYSDKHRFFADMYDGTILRKSIALEGGSAVVTGTIGCASFPADADNYTDLFNLMDKTLYLGKSKGRNCFIIYVEEKHKDIEIKKLVKHNIYTDMVNLRKLFDEGNTLHEKLNSALSFLSDSMLIKNLVYVDKDDHMISASDESMNIDVSGISDLIKEDLYTLSSIDEIKDSCPLLFRALDKQQVEAVMITRVGNDIITEGYLICGVQRRFRIWQENECAIMYYLANLIFSQLHS